MANLAAAGVNPHYSPSALLGETLLTKAKQPAKDTTELLEGKDVIGLYFSVRILLLLLPPPPPPLLLLDFGGSFPGINGNGSMSCLKHEEGLCCSLAPTRARRKIPTHCCMPLISHCLCYFTTHNQSIFKKLIKPKY
jgi:hypothetical protein